MVLVVAIQSQPPHPLKQWLSQHCYRNSNMIWSIRFFMHFCSTFPESWVWFYYFVYLRHGLLGRPTLFLNIDQPVYLNIHITCATLPSNHRFLSSCWSRRSFMSLLWLCIDDIAVLKARSRQIPTPLVCIRFYTLGYENYSSLTDFPLFVNSWSSIT